MRQLLAGLFVVIMVAVLFGSQNTATQQIRVIVDSVALLEVSRTTFALEITEGAFVEGERAVFDNIEGGTIWYTSVSTNGKSRSITASLSDPTILDFMETAIEVRSPESGVGELGHSSGRVILSDVPKVILSNIGTGWTGRAQGATFIYDVEVRSPEKLASMAMIVDVIFTFSGE